jgi:hypothetical protein
MNGGEPRKTDATEFFRLNKAGQLSQLPATKAAIPHGTAREDL